MPTHKPYDVTLEPLDKFFFGGEVVFGQLGNRDGDRRSDYLVKSEILPQQTSLLGVLRYALLQRERKLAPYGGPTGTKDRERAHDLVGKESFRLAGDPKNWQRGSFGAIDRIGPLSIYEPDNGRDWPLIPLDVGTGKHGKGLAWQRTDYGYWKLKNLDPKEGLDLHFQPVIGEPVALGELFDAQEQAGNRIANRLYRNADGIDAGEEDEGFFRQTFYRNTPDRRLGFRFRAWLDEEVLNAGVDAGAMDGYKSKVSLGGERCPFRLSVKQATDGSTGPKPTGDGPLAGTTGYRRLLLESDTYLPSDLIAEEDFVVANPKPFRFLQSSLQAEKGTKNFNRRVESGRYTLLQRGGVILVSDNRKNDLLTAIQNIEPFFQIGYNHCRYV